MISHLLHIITIVKLLNEIIQLNGANCLWISMGFFDYLYMSFMSHNKGVVTNLGGELISKFEDSSPNDDEGVVWIAPHMCYNH